MTLSSFAGSFLTTTGTSDVAVTGVGFTPKAIIFYWIGRTEAIDTIGRASHFRGFGFAAGATDRRSICCTSLDAAATSDGGSYHTDAACVLSCTHAGAIDGALDLVSFDADGFTLAVDDAFPRNQRIGFLALGGDSLTNVATGTFTEPVATGNQDVPGLAFQPDCVLFFGAGITTAPPSGSTISSIAGFGAAVSSSQRGVWAGGQDDGAATSVTRSYAISSECIALLNASATTLVGRADFVQFNVDGFRVNWPETNAAGNRRYHFLALKGGNYAVGNLLTQTDTTTDIVETGFGFAPTGALLLSRGGAENTADTAVTEDRLSIGAFSGTAQRNAQAILDEHNLADIEVTTALEFDAVYANINTSSAIDGLMDIKSIDADGFTCIMDDADPAQSFVWYLAVGPAAAVGGGQAPRSMHQYRQRRV